QSLQTVLISIDERLRALDTIYSPRYTPRWEVSLEQQSRRMETIESRLSRLETLLELRLDKLSELAMVENGKNMATEMNNLTTRMEDLHYEFNRTQLGNEQNDDEGIDTEKNINMMVEKITNGIDKHANNFITKANNMYNDMWRRTQLLEGLAKDTMSLSNATRRELQEGIRTIAVQMGRRGLFQSDRERQEVDNHISDIASINTDREMGEILDLLKSHSAHMTRSIGHTTNTVLQSSEKSSQLQVELLSVKEQLLEGNKYIEDAISDIREEKLTASEKLDTIATTLQEVLDSIAQVARTSKESHNFRASSECPDNEQIALEILAEIQRKQLRPLMNNTEFDDTDEGFGEESDNENYFESDFQVEHERENITENKIKNSSMENIPAFQLQHRFDVQTSRSDDVNGTPQVMIEIIPDRTKLQSNRTEDELEHVVRDSEESLFGFDLQNVAAIIHDTDSGEDEKRQKPILAIVHTILQTGENNTHIKKNLDDTYSQINLNTEINNISNTKTTNHFTEYEQSSLETSTYIPVLLVGGNQMLNMTNPNETVHQDQMITENEHKNVSVKQNNASEIRNTNSSEQYTDQQMSVLLRKIMELYSHDERHNSTVSNMWRTFILKFQNHSTTMTNNGLNFTEVNTLAGKPFSVDSAIIHSLTTPPNETEDGGQQQYLSRLQELETELMAPSNMTNEDIEEMLER
ncbi:hypothetical protein C0J52_14349, partial [Blattella germanica]